MAAAYVIDRLKAEGKATSRKQLFEVDVKAGQEVLQRVKLNNGQVSCLCRLDHRELPMTVAKLDSSYHLRRFKNQGSLHHPDCASYGGINERAAELYEQSVVSEVGDKLAVKIDGPMSEIVADGFKDDAPAVVWKATKKMPRSSMTLLGFLNYLWEECDLNIWRPGMEGKRGHWTVRNEISKAATGVLFKQNRRLSDFLFIPDQNGDAKTRTATSAALTAHLNRVAGLGNPNEACFGVVIGEVLAMSNSSDRGKALYIKLKGMDAPIWDDHGVIGRLESSFKNPVARHHQRVEVERKERAARVNGGVGQAGTKPLESTFKLIGIFLLGLNKKGDGLVLKRAALMETSARYIPISSEYEGRVEEKLRAEGRAFKKPLVYDGERAVFPDFELLDTSHKVCPALEVYGYDGDEYEERKREKHAQYEKDGTPYWYWDLKVTDEIPSFDKFPRAVRIRGEGRK